MARPSEVHSYGITGVVWLESEFDETEFLYCPGLKFMWDQPIPLREGDQFLQWIENLDVVWLNTVLFERDLDLLHKLYVMWRRSLGEFTEDELKEKVVELQRDVAQLLKALKATLQQEGEDVELESELAELRAERLVS